MSKEEEKEPKKFEKTTTTTAQEDCITVGTERKCRIFDRFSCYGSICERCDYYY